MSDFDNSMIIVEVEMTISWSEKVGVDVREDTIWRLDPPPPLPPHNWDDLTHSPLHMCMYGHSDIHDLHNMR